MKSITYLCCPTYKQVGYFSTASPDKCSGFLIHSQHCENELNNDQNFCGTTSNRDTLKGNLLFIHILIKFLSVCLEILLPWRSLLQHVTGILFEFQFQSSPRFLQRKSTPQQNRPSFLITGSPFLLTLYFRGKMCLSAKSLRL